MRDVPGARTDSTIDHLPQMFRHARDRSALLRGILDASDQTLLALDDRLDEVHLLLDPWTTNADASGQPHENDGLRISFLAWLASWFDFERQLHWTTRFLRELELDERRVEARRRLVVAEATSLSRRKGTKTGLEQVLWGCLGIRIEVIERSWSERMIVGVSGAEARLLNHYEPARMVEVVWHVSRAPSESLLAGVRDVINHEVPAHINVLLRVAVREPAASPPAKCAR